VRSQNLSECRRLLSEGADVDERMELGLTALHTACMLVPTNKEVVEVLLTYGANVDVENIQEMTPFQLACMDRSFEIAGLLLQHGSHIDKTNRNGDTAVHFAIKSDNWRSLEFLCANRANVNAVTGTGDTPLTLASGKGDAHMVRVLISYGADVNFIQTNNQQNSELLLGIIGGSAEVVSELVEHRADVMYQNRDSENALFLACRLNRAAVVHYLCREIVGVDLDMRQDTSEGLTALMIAAKYNATDAARVLLSSGCDLWMKSLDAAHSVTAYQLAVEKGNTAVAELIDSYANPPTTRLY